MLKACIKSLADDKAQPVTLRAAARGVIGSINFALIIAAQAEVREMVNLLGEAPGVDGYNALFASREAKKEEAKALEEQGGYVKMPEAMRCGYLAVLAEMLNKDLSEHADTVLVTSGPLKGKEVANPYHVGDPLSFTFRRQVDRKPQGLTAEQKMTARILGITEDEQLASDARMAASNAAFLTKYKAEILETAGKYYFDNPEGWDIEALFDKLSAIDQLRLMIAADNGLYFVRDTTAKRYVRNSSQKELFTDVGLLDGERVELQKRINAFCKVETNKRMLLEARDRGETIPTMRALVAPIADPVAKAA